MNTEKRVLQLFDRAIENSSEGSWHSDFEVSVIRDHISKICKNIAGFDSESIQKDEQELSELFFAEPATRENISLMLELHREMIFQHAFK